MSLRMTGRTSALALAGVFAAAGSALAIGGRPVIATAMDNTLTVHGHAELQAKPDVAYATLGVTTQSTVQATAVNANTQRVKAVITALKRDGISDKDIQTQYYTVQPQYSYPSNTRTGFQVQNSVRVTVRDLNKAGQVIDDATTAGATDVSSLSFDLSDRSRVQGQALVAAVANARSKADLLAGAAGIDLYQVVTLTEGTPPEVIPIMYNTFRAKGAEADSGTPIQQQQITVAADVTVSYAIGASQK